MPIFTLTLQQKRDVARDTIQFDFEKPEGFNFIPGQYGGFTLINPTESDAGGNTRRFSLLSSPNDEFITITTRIQSSAYKRNLINLPIGGQIKFAGPTGIFTLNNDVTASSVMIAGGIGVAPFYSIIKHATETNSTRELILFYGNNSRIDAAYLTELESYASNNPNFKLIPVFVNPDSDWQGEIGYINHTMIRKYIPDINDPYYYICGSPTMVTTLQETLAEMDINLVKVKVEDFPGY